MKVTRFTKFLVFMNCAVPLVLLGWDAGWGELGANPVNFAIRTTGILALIFLLLSLVVTPLSRIKGWSSVAQLRRMLGLYAFFHALLHFMIFFVLDREGSISGTVSEVIKRPYLLVGMVGLLVMVPLAVTSTDGMVKRLGAVRWKRLHRLAYPAAIAGVVHYYMLVKADVTQPVAFAAALLFLLGYRVVAHYLGLRAAYRKLSTVGTPARPRFWKGQLRVARVFDETPTVRTFRLAPLEGTRLPFDFMPGQYLNLAVVVDGKKVHRSYTIASSPTVNAYCELTVKREAMGVASGHLHSVVREGVLIDISAPAGRFTFTGAEAPSVVMIAGGVGITPLMSKIRYLTDISWPGRIVLFHAVRSVGERIFAEELAYLSRRHPNLRVTVTVTGEADAEWVGYRGRITAEMLARVVPDIAEQRVHICGPDAMTEGMIEILKGLGVGEDQIHHESFTPAARSEPMERDGEVVDEARAAGNGVLRVDSGSGGSVRFARSGKSKLMSANETVLEASEELGVEIAYDCRAGICGRCKTKLLAGNVVMEVQAALDAVDLANDMILSCQARCVDEVLVDA